MYLGREGTSLATQHKHLKVPKVRYLRRSWVGGGRRKTKKKKEREMEMRPREIGKAKERK